MRPKSPCGTPAAYQRHSREGTIICGPCRKAWSEYVNSRSSKLSPERLSQIAETVEAHQDLSEATVEAVSGLLVRMRYQYAQAHAEAQKQAHSASTADALAAVHAEQNSRDELDEIIRRQPARLSRPLRYTVRAPMRDQADQQAWNELVQGYCRTVQEHLDSLYNQMVEELNAPG